MYTTDVVLEEVEFAESKNAGSNSGPRANPGQASTDGFMNIPDDLSELPFN